MIRWDFLEEIAGAKRQEWDSSPSTRFLVIDGLLEPGAGRALSDFSGMEHRLHAVEKRTHKHVRGKFGSPRPDFMTTLQRQFFEVINAERFLGLLRRMTGIEPLYADPSLNGGGLHQIRRGGYLNVHADFNIHPKTGRHRRLNLLLYLNETWNDDWGGQIELWGADLDRPFFAASPVMNRAVVFETTENSYHGHPTPLATPPGVTRKSLAAYYYSDWPAGLEPRVSTDYQLTRLQWATLIQKIAAIVAARPAEESDVVNALILDHQSADIRTAYRALHALRSFTLTGEPYWEHPNGDLSLAPP